MRLTGKHAIVTGAGSGIGRAATRIFAEEGATVTAVDLDEAAVAETLDGLGAGHAAVIGSVADPTLWDRAVAQAEQVDVAYLNAGVYGFTGPIDEIPLELYRRTIDANVDGVVLGVRAVVPAMRAAGGGAIVATASVAGVVAFQGNPVYTLTKQAVTGFVRAVAAGLAADGISIDAICPGVVDTPMTRTAAGGHQIDPGAIPLIAPETVAGVALDLATSEGTGRCRVVRLDREPVDWDFPGWEDLAQRA
jgi:NAD(P)-dependent dehydrogenase (short-subunit alcohol dehydrogenase family)